MEDDRTGTSAACNYRRDPAGAGRLRAARPDGKAAGTAEDDPGFRLLPRADGDAGNGAGRGLLHGKALRGRLAARADASGRPERGDGGGKPRRAGTPCDLHHPRGRRAGAHQGLSVRSRGDHPRRAGYGRHQRRDQGALSRGRAATTPRPRAWSAPCVTPSRPRGTAAIWKRSSATLATRCRTPRANMPNVALQKTRRRHLRQFSG